LFQCYWEWDYQAEEMIYFIENKGNFDPDGQTTFGVMSIDIDNCWKDEGTHG